MVIISVNSDLQSELAEMIYIQSELAEMISTVERAAKLHAENIETHLNLLNRFILSMKFCRTLDGGDHFC